MKFSSKYLKYQLYSEPLNDSKVLSHFHEGFKNLKLEEQFLDFLLKTAKNFKTVTLDLGISEQNLEIVENDQRSPEDKTKATEIENFKKALKMFNYFLINKPQTQEITEDQFNLLKELISQGSSIMTTEVQKLEFLFATIGEQVLDTKIVDYLIREIQSILIRK